MVRDSSSRLVAAVTALTTLTAIGTAGFAWIEELSFLDALYMTVITLSTVGYREVAPLSPEGRGFTIGLIVVGLGTVFYTVSALAEFVIAGRLREIMGRRNVSRAIGSLRGHVIVCGFGRLGRSVAERLKLAHSDLVVIDSDPAVQAECDDRGLLFVSGSALEDAVLSEAGIERAGALVAATSSDPDNVFITLAARELNPAIAIHASAGTPAASRRLSRSGAHQVVSPHAIAGQRIANAIVRPGVVEFLELSVPGEGSEVDLEEIQLAADSEIAGARLRDLPEQQVQVSVVAIKRGDEPLLLNPGVETELCVGDRIIAIGDSQHLGRLARLAASPA